ncbi:hypothetical protein AB0D78_32130 [Streptomyces avermitilis]|uniref:hypothetical protein n=1 Tax=Streptomyces avermitilis TaxID=33903 RepID=UPI0033A5D9A6
MSRTLRVIWGEQLLFVHGGPTTAIVKGPTGESVVLLSGELPADLTDTSIGELLDLAAAVLTEGELALFEQCLTTLRRGEGPTPQRIEVNGAVMTVYRD